MANHDEWFSIEGNKVVIKIATGLPEVGGYNRTLIFKRECTSELEAHLLLEYLTKKHNECIQSIRRKEFFSGWRHAKSKKHGKKFFDWFMSNMKNESSHEEIGRSR